MGFWGWFIWFFLCGGFSFGVCFGVFSPPFFPALGSLFLQQTSVRAQAAVGPIEPSQQNDGQRKIWSCFQEGSCW